MRRRLRIVRNILLFTLLLLSHAWGITLTDDFENNSTNGWINTQGVQAPGGNVPTQVLQLTNNDWGYKTYFLGASLGGNQVNVSFDLYTSNVNSGDLLYIYDSATGLYTFYAINSAHMTITFTATISNDGSFLLYLYPLLATGNNANIYVDNITLLSQSNLTGYRDFSLRYQASFKGKMETIGNTILVAPIDQSNTICNTYTNGAYIDNANTSNDQYQLCAYYADANVSFPTTKATLPFSASGSNARVRWAGLYWQSMVPNANQSLLNTMQIKLKHQNAPSYTTITPVQVDKKVDAIIQGYTNYSAFADVSNYFRDNNYTGGDIYVGDIPTTEGKISQLGTYGAWMLVVIYEDNAELLQNFSIYDGWTIISPAHNTTSFTISGFRTPTTSSNIYAQMSVFTAEGDKYIPGDELRIKPSKQTTDTVVTNNFDSTISPATMQRTPYLTNNQGIDIHTYDLGTSGLNIIANKESSMDLQFSSNLSYDTSGNARQDAYWPSVVAFSAQLYTPQLCYDYIVRIGDTIIPDVSNRDINTTLVSNTPLKIEFLIHSDEADFTYINTNANIRFNSPSHQPVYNHDYAQMSPPFSYAYFSYLNHPEIETNATKGQIAIGGNVIGNAQNRGGTLFPNESTYGVLGYDLNATGDPNADQFFSSQFDIEVETQIEFTPGTTPVDFFFTTQAAVGEASYIRRCDINQTYNPVLRGFNVERVDAPNDQYTAADPNARFTLHTQVTGRSYSVDIVAYEGDVRYASSTPIQYDNAVEIELIDADAFLNSASTGYDTTCQRPSSIGEGVLIDFGGKSRKTINIPQDWPGYRFDHAMRNAAFRLWLLTKVDTNGSKRVVPTQCTDKSNSDNCFSNVYSNYIKDANNTLCDTACTQRNPQCYQCLKSYYATPICSRDNFAIRPEAFGITFFDDNDSDSSNAISIVNNQASGVGVPLSAGYLYGMQVQTKSKTGNDATGYFANFPLQPIAYSARPAPLSSGTVAISEFVTVGNCADTNHYTMTNTIKYNNALLLQPLTFFNGVISPNTHVLFNNVGNYNVWIADSNWTIVDQNSIYGPYPTFDCAQNSDNSNTGELAGCAFNSTKRPYDLLRASVYPYAFDVSDINISVYPDNRTYTYYNDLNHSYYNSHPIDNAATTFNGLVSARGKHIGRTSNFTQGCAATDVNITTDINAGDANSTIQRLLAYEGSTQSTVKMSVSMGNTAPITLPSAAFPDSSNIPPGKAKVYLYTTLQKSKTTPQNPATVLYRELKVSSSDASSYADMQSSYIPSGAKSYSNDITYYFTKITPQRTLYGNIVEAYKLTPIYVDIYCSLGASCNTPFNLTTPTKGLNEDPTIWYSSVGLFDPSQDGTVDLSVQTLLGQNASPQVTLSNGATATAVRFIDTNVSRQDVNVSLSANGRPSTVDVTIKPLPWLLYDPIDPNGYPHYRLQFIDSATWSGVGNTGYTTEVTSSQSINRPRLTW